VEFINFFYVKWELEKKCAGYARSFHFIFFINK